jgi:2-methylcitrate dehydratase PrpD
MEMQVSKVTGRLAEWLIGTSFSDIPEDVRHEARRALLNYVGCALGGAHEEAVEIAFRTLSPLSGPRTATILGRREKLDPLRASLINGIAAHVHDYDDTTPKNYGHLSAPTLSALLPFACTAKISGADFLHAFILGFEASSRIGNAVYPAHYNVGWHMTGTVGVFGAAAGIGRLLKLNSQQMLCAIGLAATQAAGIREMFGSMGKAFHPGRSAEAGYLAALLALNGFTSGGEGLEGPRGFAAVLSASSDLNKIIHGLGVDFDLRENTYKPYPCGIVIHPTIEACILLREKHGFDPEDIQEVDLSVAPLVLDLCRKQFISVGLEGKFSVFHAAAIGLVRGKGGLQEFSDAAVNDPQIKRVRELARASTDRSVADDAVKVEVRLKDGSMLGIVVPHAIGNLERPLSDRQLESKFRDQAERSLQRDGIDKLIELCWSIDKLEACDELIAAAIPQKILRI